MAKNPRLIDLTGQRFGELTVIRQDGNTKRGGAIWVCRCSCGKENRPTGSNLRQGKVRSCGHDRMEKFWAASRTHGQSNTRLYRTWKAMRARCSLPTDTGYENYGGRGIRVCDEWQASFEAFATWAAKTGYRDDLSIDRIDNDGNYEPGNCRWVGVEAQAINKRNVALAPDGRPWSKVAADNGISLPAFRTRICEGWDHELAATWPMYKKRPRKAA